MTKQSPNHHISKVMDKKIVPGSTLLHLCIEREHNKVGIMETNLSMTIQ